LISANGSLILHGGVLQGSGNYTATLGYYNAPGHVAFNVDNDYSYALGGGFSARGGQLTVELYNASGSNTLIWGGTQYFLI
jgi:hypothetical protein